MVQIINSGLNVQDPACELELSVFPFGFGKRETDGVTKK